LPRRPRYPLLPGGGIGIEGLTFRRNSSLCHRRRFGNRRGFSDGLGFPRSLLHRLSPACGGPVRRGSFLRCPVRRGFGFRRCPCTYRLAFRFLFFPGALLRGALVRGNFFRGYFLSGSFFPPSRARAGFPVGHERSLPPLIGAHKMARANGGRRWRGSVSKPRFPDPGFDRLRSTRGSS